MKLSSTAKRLSIATGMYRPARWISRRVRPNQFRAFRGDIELFRSLIPENALSFDVGANIGGKSEALLAAGARVVAFEPNPLVVPELRSRCRNDKNWNFVQSAIGDGPAIAVLHAREHHGASSLDENWGDGKLVSRYLVPVVTLDSAIRCFGVPFYCKIDVEGWEKEVLSGLTRPIPLISIEFHLTAHEIRKTLECLKRLQEFGPARINLTPAESATYHFEQWMPLQAFIDWFPGDLHQTLPGYKYGNIFVLNDSARQRHAADETSPR